MSDPRVDDFFIGGLDAWRDDKHILLHAFVPVRQFTELSYYRNCFLCGRRGSGKSAIAIMSGRDPAWACARIIEGEREQYGAYMDLVSAVVNAEVGGSSLNTRRFVQGLWRYALRILVLQIVVRNADQLHVSEDRRVHAIREFLQGRQLLERDMGAILHSVFEEAAAYAGPHLENMHSALAWLHEAYNLPEFRSSIAELSEVLGTRRILVILDTLESYQIHNEPMKKGLQGIVAAVLDVLGDESLKNFHICFFIPAEIYEDVAAETPAKVANSTVFLRWRSGDLFTLLAKRYFERLRQIEAIAPDRIEALGAMVNEAVGSVGGKADGRILRRYFWYANGFLPTKVANTYGTDEDCLAYLLRHTQRRPRELIWLLNQIIHEAHGQGELPGISAKSVVQGLHNPITLEVLVTDMLSPYEGYLKHIADKARAVLYGKRRVLTGDDLKRLARTLHDLEPVGTIDPDQFVGYLLRAGTIGLIKDPEESRRKGKGHYTLCLFEYLMQGHVAFSKDRLYYVHPAVGDYFGMAKDEEYGPAYPTPQDDIGLERELVWCV